MIARQRGEIYHFRKSHLGYTPQKRVDISNRVVHCLGYGSELCDFGFDGLSSGASPDRLDALVWAVTALTMRGWDGPRIRSLWGGPSVPAWWRGP
jgi:hypothetical protein